MQQANDVRATLPVHGTGAAPGPETLRVDGLVARPLALTMADLRALAAETLVDDFTCLEGWTVPGVRWQGVRLAAVLDLAQVRPEARWVQASAGEGAKTFSLPLPLAESRRGFLAYGLGRRPLAPEHGGPLRLVVPGRECFTSIKWLDHLQVRAEPGVDTARAIATGRLARREADAIGGQAERDATW